MSASVLPESGVARSDDVSDKRRAAASALREIELRSTHTPRTVRVGILGLGQVGQAVARIAQSLDGFGDGEGSRRAAPHYAKALAGYAAARRDAARRYAA